ncbi:MAG TPA: sigma-54 dependent transcriptional regulator [Vicinamibacteria bacterium]|nr:sigma-54 dependent transcriptional regulator [Vicinamibacteria bacterium]
MKRILIVDDEQSMRELLAILLKKEGFEVATAGSRAEAAKALAGPAVDMVLTDVRLPDGDGLEILRHVKSASPETVVIVMTAFGTTETAVAARKLGAEAYVLKPFDVDEVRIVIRDTLATRDLRSENVRLKREVGERYGLDRLIGVSAAMASLFEMVRAVAPASSTVLISGESGTGKELVARAIHALSSRADKPFVSVNCGALPDTLLESELFGHVKGAFTDAHQAKKGLFEAAHGGTLFLDEVGETSPAMQVKLLRALQDRRVRRVGGTEEMDVDVRVIAATNALLEERVKEKRFREDLFYRLQVIPIHAPPLRERREDIPILAQHFFERFARAMDKRVAKISDAALEALKRYSWPGNVRELENVIERAVALETTEAVLPERLPEAIRASGRVGEVALLGPGFSLDDHLRSIEARLLLEALERAAGDRGRAAAILGVSPRSLRYLLQKHVARAGRS